MTDLVYENYNKRSVAVRGDKDKYQKVMNNIGAKWNPRMKDGPGWLVPKENEPELQRLIRSFKKMSKLDEIAVNAKSRKSQHKYHREFSESEKESSSNDEKESSSEDEESDSTSNTEVPEGKKGKVQGGYLAWKETNQAIQRREVID